MTLMHHICALGRAMCDTTAPTQRAEAIPPTQAPPARVDLTMRPVRRSAPRLLVLCACGHWIDWRAAPWVGVQQDDEQRLELRNCPRCESTRAMVTATTEDER